MSDNGYSHNLRQLPDGSFEAVWEGGVELPVTVGASSVAGNSVRFNRTSDDALIADLAGYLQSIGPWSLARVVLSAQHPDASDRRAWIEPQAWNGHPSLRSRVVAGVQDEFGSLTRDVLRSDGTSDYVLAAGLTAAVDAILTSHGLIP